MILYPSFSSHRDRAYVYFPIHTFLSVLPSTLLPLASSIFIQDHSCRDHLSQERCMQYVDGWRNAHLGRAAPRLAKPSDDLTIFLSLSLSLSPSLSLSIFLSLFNLSQIPSITYYCPCRMHLQNIHHTTTHEYYHRHKHFYKYNQRSDINSNYNRNRCCNSKLQLLRKEPSKGSTRTEQKNHSWEQTAAE